jgi:hypothetical protein
MNEIVLSYRRMQVEYLLEEIGIKRCQLAKILCACPQLISMSVAGKLRRNVSFLLSIGLPREKLPAVVAAFPQARTRNGAEHAAPPSASS